MMLAMVVHNAAKGAEKILVIAHQHTLCAACKGCKSQSPRPYERCNDMNPPSPCLNCGACCATFRVSFYWGETDAAPGGLVPQHLTEQISPSMSCMQGTNQPNPRCSALIGQVGEGVRCNIYEKRSSTCREFAWHGENGLSSEACQRARARHGLAPLPDLLEPAPIVAA